VPPDPATSADTHTITKTATSKKRNKKFFLKIIKYLKFQVIKK
jgi:hypothetical protein